MLTGELRNKIDAIWDVFWSSGISNPLEVIEQFTYLIFIKRLDDMNQLRLSRRERIRQGKIKGNVEDVRLIFPEKEKSLRWSEFRNFGSPDKTFEVVKDKVFPFLRQLGGQEEDSTYSQHMKDARFTIPTASLLSRVIDLIDKLPLDERDTKGDLYEYMLGKIASAGQNGQFRTPRHIIQLMVEMTAPSPKDVICDPASGTCGFLVGAAEYLAKVHEKELMDKNCRDHFNNKMFHGYDFDRTMLRIGSMNMLLHGVEKPDVSYRDSLSENHAGEEDKYTLLLANPPFAGSLDKEAIAKDLKSVVDTKKTELLFLALFLKLLKPGGRAAVIVPDGVLFGSSKAHKQLRKILVEEQKLDGVVSLPSGVFKPYAGVSTAILFFTKTNSGGTDNVWFYDMQADGWSLDDKRIPLLSDDKVGVKPEAALTDEEHIKNNLPDVLKRWNERAAGERERKRTDQSFCVPKADIAAQGYDLSINRYKEVIHEVGEHLSPREILAALFSLETEIQENIKALDSMLQ